MPAFAKNLLTLLVSVGLFYGLLEIFVWRPNLMSVPLRLHQQLGYLGIFAQPSKKAALPEPGFVAIFGDSYAEGLGDHLMKVIGDGNPKFHAGHFLHDLTGRDVLSFGVRGGNPVFTLGYFAANSVAGIDRYAGVKLPDAGDVLAYVYEGNDITDVMSGIESDEVADPGHIARQIEKMASDGKKRARRHWTVFGNAHLADTMGRLIKLSYKNITRKKSLRLLQSEDPSFRAGGAYREDWTRYEASKYFVLTGGKKIPYPSPTVEPVAFHSRRDIEVSAVYFQAGFRALRALFPRARLWVVYIPSPVNAYELAQPEIVLQDRIIKSGRDYAGPITLFSDAALAEKSDAICNEVAKRALETGARFIDTRPALREASRRTGYLHGPNDPGHFNKAGYEALAAILRDGLRGEIRPDCGSIRPR